MCTVNINSLDVALSAMYIRRYFTNGTVKENILEMVQTIRNEQYNILSVSDWIDNETKYGNIIYISINFMP